MNRIILTFGLILGVILAAIDACMIHLPAFDKKTDDIISLVVAIVIMLLALRAFRKTIDLKIGLPNVFRTVLFVTVIGLISAFILTGIHISMISNDSLFAFIEKGHENDWIETGFFENSERVLMLRRLRELENLSLGSVLVARFGKAMLTAFFAMGLCLVISLGYYYIIDRRKGDDKDVKKFKFSTLFKRKKKLAARS